MGGRTDRYCFPYSSPLFASDSQLGLHTMLVTPSKTLLFNNIKLCSLLAGWTCHINDARDSWLVGMQLCGCMMYSACKVAILTAQKSASQSKNHRVQGQQVNKFFSRPCRKFAQSVRLALSQNTKNTPSKIPLFQKTERNRPVRITIALVELSILQPTKAQQGLQQILLQNECSCVVIEYRHTLSPRSFVGEAQYCVCRIVFYYDSCRYRSLQINLTCRFHATVSASLSRHKVRMYALLHCSTVRAVVSIL